MSPRNETRLQLLRYAIIGVAANASLYAAYLVLNALGVGHLLAMTVTYCTSVLCTFLFNRRWTFDHRGKLPAAAMRYGLVYVLGYIFNFGALALLVDGIGLPHAPVMAALIIISAALIFLAQKYWVFVTGHEALRS